MIAQGKTARRYGLVLELGGKDLKDYYYERDPQDGERLPRSNEPVLIEIIKGAARALAQFHQFGGHGDIGYYNFLVSRDQATNDGVIDVKLIDFEISKLYEVNERDIIEKRQRDDVFSFGEMVYEIFNEKYFKGAI